jgi:hypothetical protein
MVSMINRFIRVPRSYRPAVIVGTLLCFLAPPPASAELTLVRLTPDEYERIIHQVFGSTIEVGDNNVQPGFRDEGGLLAVGERKLSISSRELEVYDTLARNIAAQIVHPSRRATLIHCQPQSETAPDSDCAAEFLERAGLFLMRRPLTDQEVRSYVATHATAARKLEDFYAGLAIAIERMLVEPEFLFRVERSEADPAQPGKLKLDAYSRASRLSFFLWDTAPDAELLAAAESGELLEEEGVKRQLDRMLLSSRMEDGVRAFFTDMLGFDEFATLDVDTARYPKFTKNVENDAREQTLRTIVHHLLNEDKPYRDLFTTPETFLTPALAALYGVPLPRSQELGGAVPWVNYRFDENAPYVGLLGQISFLSLNSHPGRTSPTLRGKALRERLLCQRVPPPPGNVDFNLVQDTSNPKYKTARQRLTAHASEPVCAGCHKITDPIGLALENFDTAGGFRAMENGAPIDATGTLNGMEFDGLKELARVIENDPSASSCLIERAFAYGTARESTEAELEWLENLHSELKADGVRWGNLMRQVVLSPGFFTVVVPAEQDLSVRAER